MSYIFILIGFVIFVFVFQKFQNKTMQHMSSQASAHDPFRELAAQLGLGYETFTPNSGKNVLYSSGSKMSGTYAGIPVEMIYAMSTQTESAMSRYAASYTMQKTIAFQVANTKNLSFHIVPKSMGAQGGSPTGNAAFDNSLLLIGNVTLPSSFLEYCASVGWMNVSLQGTTLLFNDTFYDEMKGLSGSMNMMTAAHPIWKSTATNTTIDMKSSKKLFDELVSVAKSI